MPELPEVETIKNDLVRLVVGRRIERVEVLDRLIVRYPDIPTFVRRIQGGEILSVTRRAKYLLLALSSGYILSVQLMVTGQLLLVEPTQPRRKGLRVIFDLDDGLQLRLVDSSFLARVGAVTEGELVSEFHLDALGPEAIAPDLTLEQFRERLRGRRGMIKPLLLDQRLVAGLGNIYADEVLFDTRISPRRPVQDLSDEEIARLYESMRRILNASIARRGTTTRSYRDVLGRKGDYQSSLKVHARAGEPCLSCEGTVQYEMIGGRGAYFCPACQK